MDRGVWRAKSMGLHDWACVHEGGGKWVGSNKVVELKKKKKKSLQKALNWIQKKPKGILLELRYYMDHFC